MNRPWSASAVAALSVLAVTTPVVGWARARGAIQSMRREVIDDLGERVVVGRLPERIVSLAPSNTELLFELGVGARVVGVTVHADWPRRARRLPGVGGFGQVDLEAVLALRPDLVLAAGLQAGGAVEVLRRLGVPTFVSQPASLEEMLDGIRRIGRLVDRAEAGERLARRLSSRIDAVRASVAGRPRPRVFFELSDDLFTVGPGSFLDDLLRVAGGENIAADTGMPYPRLSLEAVVARDPEVILLADHGAGVDVEDVAARPGWSRLTAVREGRVVKVEDVDTLNRPGPRIVRGLEFLARVLHGGS